MIFFFQYACIVLIGGERKGVTHLQQKLVDLPNTVLEMTGSNVHDHLSPRGYRFLLFCVCLLCSPPVMRLPAFLQPAVVLPVCPPSHTSVCESICLAACQLFCLWTCMSIRPSLSLSVCLSVRCVSLCSFLSVLNRKDFTILYFILIWKPHVAHLLYVKFPIERFTFLSPIIPWIHSVRYVL